ncbi:MAG: sulfatase, partial [Opitutaceae bacterium]|nr:sulfatase [Opitutaceae bacterium]
APPRPLDGVDLWETLARGAPSPRTEIVYNIEPFRAAVRQGDLKLVWRTLLPSSIALYDVVRDPSESTDVAAAHPEVVAQLQRRIEALAREATQPLFLVHQSTVVQHGMHGEPVLPTDEDFASVEMP